jgi:hypothetical protein
LDALPNDIERCVEFCLYFKTVYSYDTDNLLLVELARNIEYEIWIVFKILDMFYPDLAIFDSYYRIMQSSRGEVAAGLIRAKSIEYLESLIKDDHYHFLRILESISFEDGFLSYISSLPWKKPGLEHIYDKLVKHGYYWLKISAIIDMPKSFRNKYEFLLKENEDMIPVLEKIQFLKRVSLFKGFSVMELFLIAQITREIRFESGHTLFKIGDPGDALYIILEGAVEILNEEGESLASLQSPQCFGEVAVLDKSGRSATAVCNEDCRMLMITTEDFHEILEGYPVLYKNIITILTGWLRRESSHPNNV